MSVLSEQFARLRRATKPVDHQHLGIKVWADGSGYMASCSTGGGSLGGSGKTPEEAIRDAVGALIQRSSR